MRTLKILILAGVMVLLSIATFAIYAEEDSVTYDVGPFSLLAPRNHSLFHDPNALTSTVWTSSKDAVTYRFELYRVERQDDDEVDEPKDEPTTDDGVDENFPLFTLTAEEGNVEDEEAEVIHKSRIVYDANIEASSICAEGLCTFPVDAEMRSVLEEGIFKWVVKAYGEQEGGVGAIIIPPLDGSTAETGSDDRGRLALNAPFFFAIDTGDPGIPGFPGPFRLYRPRNGTVFESPQGFTVTAWTRSAGAISYHFVLNRRDDASTIIADLHFEADDICGEARCRFEITPEIQNQLTDGIYAWRVFATDGEHIRRARNSPSYFIIDTDNSVLPGTLNWIAPTGVITETLGNPTYVWQTFEGATAYEFYLARTNFLRRPIFSGTIDAATYCSEEACEIDLTTLEDGDRYWLANGDYTVYVRPDNDLWSGPFNFIIRVPDIGVVSNVSALTTTRPTISWTLEDTATQSSWFRVWVAPEERLAVPSFSKWYNRVDACGTLDSVICSVQVDVLNGEYHAYVLNWAPSGFGVGGIANTGWVGPAEFELRLPAPEPATDLTVVSTNPLILTWTGDKNASWHQVWIGTRPPEWETRFHRWILASDLGCENGGTCTLELPAADIGDGLYTWFVLSAGPGGFTLSDSLGWIQGDDFEINLP